MGQVKLERRFNKKSTYFSRKRGSDSFSFIMVMRMTLQYNKRELSEIKKREEKAIYDEP